VGVDRGSRGERRRSHQSGSKPGKNFKTAGAACSTSMTRRPAVGLFDPAKLSGRRQRRQKARCSARPGSTRSGSPLAKPDKSPLAPARRRLRRIQEPRCRRRFPEKWHGTTHQFQSRRLLGRPRCRSSSATGAVGDHIGVMSQTDSYGKLCVLRRLPAARFAMVAATAQCRAPPRPVVRRRHPRIRLQRCQARAVLVYTLGEYVEHGPASTADPDRSSQEEIVTQASRRGRRTAARAWSADSSVGDTSPRVRQRDPRSPSAAGCGSLITAWQFARAGAFARMVLSSSILIVGRLIGIQMDVDPRGLSAAAESLSG